MENWQWNTESATFGFQKDVPQQHVGFHPFRRQSLQEYVDYVSGIAQVRADLEPLVSGISIVLRNIWEKNIHS